MLETIKNAIREIKLNEINSVTLKNQEIKQCFIYTDKVDDGITDLKQTYEIKTANIVFDFRIEFDLGLNSFIIKLIPVEFNADYQTNKNLKSYIDEYNTGFGDFRDYRLEITTTKQFYKQVLIESVDMIRLIIQKAHNNAGELIMECEND